MQKARKLYTCFEYTKAMKMTGFHIYIIGTLLLNFYATSALAQLTEQTKFTGENKTITVEHAPVLSIQVEGQYQLKPYRERRPAWGKTFGVAYSTYAPTNMEPQFIQANYSDVYDSPDVPNIELNFAFKKNSPVISWGAEVSVGIFQVSSLDENLVNSSLQVIPVRVGAILLLDSLTPEGYFVPYVSGGAYTMIYKEDNNSVSVTGNTQVAPYFTAGMAFSLSWIDKHAARTSYEDSGLENTYAYLEGRSFLPAGGDKDPDFSSDINFAGGFKVEF